MKANINKFLIGICLLLAVGCMVLVYALHISPGPTRGLLLNEEMFCHIISHEGSEYIFRMHHELTSQTESSTNRRLRACLETAKKNVALFSETRSLLQKAYSYKANKDSVNVYYESIREMNGVMLTNINEYIGDTRKLKKLLKPVKMPSINNNISEGLSICRIEMDMTENFLKTHNYLNSDGTVPFCGFNTLEGMFARFNHRPWIGETFDVSIAREMKAGNEERILIFMSKKFTDKLIDSLKNSGQLNRSLRGSYEASVSINGDGFSIVPFSNETQPVSHADYTIWEYSLIPEKKITTEVEFEIGLFLLDSRNQSTIKYLPLPAINIDIR